MRQAIPWRKMGRLIAAAVVCGVFASAGAAPARAGGAPPPTLNVAAAENFYGDIVRQLGANHVNVTSILSDPNADPHEYESDPADAKAVAGAQLVIENGVGYDNFMDKLLSASPNGSRVVVNVGNLVGRRAGDNPHLWYNVDWMAQLSDTITADLEQLDAADSADYDAAHTQFNSSLQLLRDTIATIRAQYAGYRVAQTEPVAGYMMDALGISVDDGDFQHAIEEGTDPPAQAVAAMQAQIKNKQVTALLYNLQTTSSITDQLRQLAAQSGVPVVPVTETLPPSEPNYQQWMVDQLTKLQQALASGPAT